MQWFAGCSLLVNNGFKKAGLTRLELATSCVTGRHSNQLNYNPDYLIKEQVYLLYRHLDRQTPFLIRLSG